MKVVELKAFIQSQIESDEPDEISKIIREQLAGKTLNERHLDKLPGGRERWSFRPQYGMMHLEDKLYRYGKEPEKYKGFSFLLNWSEVKGATIWNADEFEERNSCYFEARKDRNRKRKALLESEELLEKLAEYMNQVLLAQVKLESAKIALKSMTSYGEAASADGYAIEKMAGIREESKR